MQIGVNLTSICIGNYNLNLDTFHNFHQIIMKSFPHQIIINVQFVEYIMHKNWKIMRFNFTCLTLNTDSLMTWLLLESFNFYELFVCLKNTQTYNLTNWKSSTLEAFFIWKRNCFWCCSYSAASSGLKLSRINGICNYLDSLE